MDPKLDIKDFLECANLPLSGDSEYLNSQNRLLDSNDDMRDLSPPIYLDEATMDVELKFENTQIEAIEFPESTQIEPIEFPVSRLGPPERANFAGDLKFEIGINGCDSHKKKYTFSKILNRLYVAMGCDFPMQFSWEWERAPRPMYVRAAVVFSDESQAEKRVERCLQHLHDPNGAGLHPAVVRNVLRSSRDLGTQGVYYCGVPERLDSWYSILVEYQAPPGVNPICNHVYQFVCKNSCNSGINRRATDIIFTLEDVTGHVYGRSTMGVRVCACPRRDMRKDEVDGQPEPAHKRLADRRPPHPPHPPPPGKRPRLTIQNRGDETIIDLQMKHNDTNKSAKVEIFDNKILYAGLKMMLYMAEQTASAKNNEITEKCERSVKSLRSAIEQLKNSC